MNYREMASAALYEGMPIRLNGDAVIDASGETLDTSLLAECVSLVSEAVSRAYNKAAEKRNRIASALDTLLGEPGASEYIVSPIPAEPPVKLAYSVINSQARYTTGTIMDEELREGIDALKEARLPDRTRRGK